jgi:hypothetical protein
MLSEKKEQQLKSMPTMNTKITKSKDGKFLIHKTEIVTIRPVAYFEAIINSEEVEYGEES